MVCEFRGRNGKCNWTVPRGRNGGRARCPHRAARVMRLLHVRWHGMPSRAPRNGARQVAHAESFAGGVSVRPIACRGSRPAQGAASGHPHPRQSRGTIPRRTDGAHGNGGRARAGMRPHENGAGSRQWRGSRRRLLFRFFVNWKANESVLECVRHDGQTGRNRRGKRAM